MTRPYIECEGPPVHWLKKCFASVDANPRSQTHTMVPWA